MQSFENLIKEIENSNQQNHPEIEKSLDSGRNQIDELNFDAYSNLENK